MNKKIRVKLEELKKALGAIQSNTNIDTFEQDLNKYPEYAVISVIDYFIKRPKSFEVLDLFKRVNIIVRQDRNYNPASQWVLVLDFVDYIKYHSLLITHKFLFDNIRTNLAIELMGGQGYFIENFSKDHEYELRKEFIEKFDKAVIRPELNLHNFIFYTPMSYDSESDSIRRREQYEKIGFSVRGYHEDKVITDDEAERLFVNAVKTERELLDLETLNQQQ